MVDLMTGNQTKSEETTPPSETKKWREHLIEMAQKFILDTTVYCITSIMFKLKVVKDYQNNVCAFLFLTVAGSQVYRAA